MSLDFSLSLDLSMSLPTAVDADGAATVDLDGGGGSGGGPPLLAGVAAAVAALAVGGAAVVVRKKRRENYCDLDESRVQVEEMMRRRSGGASQSGDADGDAEGAGEDAIAEPPVADAPGPGCGGLFRSPMRLFGSPRRASGADGPIGMEVGLRDVDLV